MAGPSPPTADDVERAARDLGERVLRTPTLASESLRELTGVPVFLKAELFQRTGSFKPRGVFTRLGALSAQERKAGVVAVSAGNHAAALAYGAARESLDCLVVSWRWASRLKLEAARGYGATVDIEADGPAEAFERMRELGAERIFVHPFDDRLVLAGQGTVALELLEDAPAVDVVLVPTGGGGLVAGMAVALAARRPAARVIAVEPELAPSLGAALSSGRPVTVSPTSIADGLNAPFAGVLPTAICRELEVEHVTVTEEEIRTGFRFLYERAKLAVEPAGAAGVAALLAGKVDAGGAVGVAVVISGGNVDAKTASGILETASPGHPLPNGVTTCEG
jgi:threonine dehydratase